MLLEHSCGRRGLDNPTLAVVDSLQGAYVGEGTLSDNELPEDNSTRSTSVCIVDSPPVFVSTIKEK
jgi:hypothetical protein